jgi:hypothetical protein
VEFIVQPDTGDVVGHVGADAWAARQPLVRLDCGNEQARPVAVSRMIDGLKKVLATWAFFALLSALLLVWLWPSPGWEHFLFVSVATLLFSLFIYFATMGTSFYFERLKKLAKR